MERQIQRSDLKTELQNTLVHTLNHFKLWGEKVDLYLGWGELESNFLEWCLKQGVADMNYIEDLVHRRLLAIGRLMYAKTKDKDGERADHTDSPHALAFAVQKGIFTKSELAQIKFDHGDTPETFMEGRVNNLVAVVIEQLRNSSKPPAVQHEYNTDDGN